MEKKTLTSLAMITFLMTSTAVIAMEEDRSTELPSAVGVQLKEAEEQGPSSSTAIAVQLNDEEQGPSSSTVTAAPTSGGILSALNPFNYWPFTSTSTPSAIPPVEEIQGGANNIPSASPAEGPGESSASTPSVTTPEDNEKGLADFLATSMVLNADDVLFQQVLDTAASDGPDALENAKRILNAVPTSTGSSSAPTDPLITEKEGFLTRWWNYWRAKPATEAGAEEQKFLTE